MSRLVISLYDVAPASAAETQRWCADADALGIPMSLLVIPGPWRDQQLADTPDFARVLRERRDRGDEVVVHGWTHVAGPQGSRTRRPIGRSVARGAAESAALDKAQAAERLAAGTTVLAQYGLPAPGFAPPGWLASGPAVHALRDAGFTHTTDHFGVRERGRRCHYFGEVGPKTAVFGPTSPK